MPQERFCSNCRAEVPPKEAACPSCGVYAGDVFDGRLPGSRRRRFRLIALLLVLIAAGAAAIWIHRSETDLTVIDRLRGTAPVEPEPVPTRVVGDRPGGARRGEGATLSEPEAIRLLRRHLVTAGRPADCLAMLSRGYERGGYIVSAVDRCEGTRLGEWRIDGKSGTISRAGLPRAP